MILKKFPFFISLQFKILRYAFGITSRVNESNNLHYLLFDCDSEFNYNYFATKYKDLPMATYPSHSGKGNHVVVFSEYTFSQAVSELLQCPYVDASYVAIGIKRGYWFLETTVPLFFRDLEYMRIERT